jgi:pyruvate formate-lyase/glycerol dehydratase family glycyl radical enzyme
VDEMNLKYWGEPFAKTYMALECKHQAYRIAYGIKNAVETMPVHLDADDTFAGNPFERSIVSYNFGTGISIDHELTNLLIENENNTDVINEIQKILEYFKGESTIEKIRNTLTDEEKKCGYMKVFWAGEWGGHTLLDYHSLLTLGTSGLKSKIADRMALTQKKNELEWLEALITICEALEIFARRYADEAHRILNSTEDPIKRSELETIEKICRKVPFAPAGTWREALQSFWMAFVFDGVDSPGRFDQYMIPYLRNSISSGEIDKTEAQHLLEKLWMCLKKTRAWNLCIGGQIPDGSDATNELSFMILDVAEKYRFQTPNLTMRCHSGTPEALWDKAIKVLQSGIGMPAFYNDDIVITTLSNYGISIEDARDYALNGCNQIDISGKSYMGLEDGELNLLKCFELATNRGCCRITGERLGPDTGDPCSFSHFEQLMDAYKTQVNYFTKLLVSTANKSQKVYADHGPNPFRSLLVSDCIEKAMDFRNGGPRYNHGQVLTEGIANTADSLSTIKKLVYEKKLFTMADLLKALDANFKGFEEMKSILISKGEHYGNDSEYVDSIACEIITHFFSELSKYKTYRGGIYGGGCSTYTRAPEFGKFVGATPDGRLSLSAVADSAGSMQGMDRNGPTALLNSVAKIDHSWTLSGYVLNLKFDKALVNQKGASENLKALIKTFFIKGGQQIQVNVTSTQDLLAARKNPEDYKSLIVRVGGFSAYFVDLSRELQDDIIARTSHEI